MTSSTSPTSASGSSAEVGSSKSMRRGCIAKARAMAVRCASWPPRQAGGIDVGLVGEADADEHGAGALVGLGGG